MLPQVNLQRPPTDLPINTLGFMPCTTSINPVLPVLLAVQIIVWYWFAWVILIHDSTVKSAPTPLCRNLKASFESGIEMESDPSKLIVPVSNNLLDSVWAVSPFIDIALFWHPISLIPSEVVERIKSLVSPSGFVTA